MPAANIVLDAAFTIAPVPRRLFGSFVEHMGRCVYTGIYEPGHPTADESGLRGDVLALTKEIGPTVVRYPGGNFVSTTCGRTASAPATSAPPAWIWPGTRSRPTPSACTSSTTGQRRSIPR